jgi:hypothetical protein
VTTSRPELSERLVSVLDARAIRLGDGYLSTWRVRETTPAPG